MNSHLFPWPPLSHLSSWRVICEWGWNERKPALFLLSAHKSVSRGMYACTPQKENVDHV